MYVFKEKPVHFAPKMANDLFYHPHSQKHIRLNASCNQGKEVRS